jgi:anti-anti-sigma factor
MCGQIDTYSAFFQSSAEKLIDVGFLHLILVLNGVDYVPSEVTGAFVQIKKATTDKRGEIAIVNVHPKVTRVLKNLSLDKFLCCTDTMDEAVAQMKSH